MIQTKKKGEWLELMVPTQWAGYSLESLFKDLWKAPKKQTHFLRTNKEVLINGLIPNWTDKLRADDVLLIKLFGEEDYGYIPQYYDIDVIYEDDHLLVVNKPAGMDTHPNSPEQTNTLANAVAFHLQSQGEVGQVKHIHRLDRDTTGAILFAKHAFIGAILDKRLEERKIKRTYTALVEGIVKKKKGTINEPIGRDRHHPTRRRVSPSGQPAITHCKVVQTYVKENKTLVSCLLDTGRTHQIRVHMSHIGHPLLGDSLYNEKNRSHRQALHAVKLEFEHPLTLANITCHAPFLDTPPLFKNVNYLDF